MSKSKGARAQLREWLRTGTPPSCPPETSAAVLVEEARRQGLAGLLHPVARSPRAPWPPSAIETLARAHREALVRGVRQLEMGARAARLLAQAGLRSLPLKGAAVAEWLYPSVADRPMADVDLLALDDPKATERVLQAGGFREMDRADHAVALLDTGCGGVLELHFSPTSCPGLFPVDAEGLWSRSRPAAGQIARIPAPEDVLLHLCLHAAFQHGLVLSLVQWLDFRRLLERAPVDTEQLLDQAVRIRAVPALAAALEVAEAVVAAPVPPALRAALPPGRARARARSPLAFLSPAEPALARARWQLMVGRRLELLRLTLRGARGASPESSWASLARGLRLLRRWAWPSIRAWRATP